ncbi:hypothetical protein GE061_006562 [Apolygus lucorum]|uniref:Chitin-binding type-2 domain-containing protein n=1 Tax=Apolygus lucorum TaxID=248454 RepID=A0A8S9WVK4_APOLU|nr:hypothetical protein GE061_006562 [Apolygus lucorum]
MINGQSEPPKPKKPAGGPKNPPAEPKKSPAESKKPPADSKKPPADSKKPPADSKKPPADSKKPPADSKLPINTLQPENKCTAEGFFGIKNKCFNFFRCVGSGPGYAKYEFQCGPGTVWDPKINTCNHASAAGRTDCK